MRTCTRQGKAGARQGNREGGEGGGGVVGNVLPPSGCGVEGVRLKSTQYDMSEMF